MEDNTIPIKIGKPGAFYVSTKGMRLQFVRRRPSGGVVVISLASGGHELVIPDDYPVIPDGDAQLPVIVPTDERAIATQRLQQFIRAVLMATEITMDDVAMVTGIDISDIKKILGDMVGQHD